MISHDSNPRCVGGESICGNIVRGVRFRHITKPPSTTRTCPVMYEAYSEQRNAVDHAISAGVPRRASGIWAMMVVRACSGMAPVIAVSMNPGAIALQRILRDASSLATDFVS